MRSWHDRASMARWLDRCHEIYSTPPQDFKKVVPGFRGGCAQYPPALTAPEACRHTPFAPTTLRELRPGWRPWYPSTESRGGHEPAMLEESPPLGRAPALAPSGVANRCRGECRSRDGPSHQGGGLHRLEGDGKPLLPHRRERPALDELAGPARRRRLGGEDPQGVGDRRGSPREVGDLRSRLVAVRLHDELEGAGLRPLAWRAACLELGNEGNGERRGHLRPSIHRAGAGAAAGQRSHEARRAHPEIRRREQG